MTWFAERQDSPRTELGECGGHFWAPALEKGAGPSVRPQRAVR